MSIWTGNEGKMDEQDVKPITIADTPKKSKAASTTKSNQNNNNSRPLKSLLKRASTEAIVVVKSSSGTFICEPRKERNEKRPRLTFDNLPV